MSGWEVIRMRKPVYLVPVAVFAPTCQPAGSLRWP
jgi:hypothetical protein